MLQAQRKYKNNWIKVKCKKKEKKVEKRVACQCQTRVKGLGDQSLNKLNHDSIVLKHGIE